MEIIYSAQKSGFVKGRTYQNPRFFQEGTARKDATSVIVIGDWPTVVATYEQLNIPVTKLPIGTKLPSSELGAISEMGVPAAREQVSDPVDIPEDLDGMSYRDLRNLCLQIDPTADISSKKSAIEFLNSKRPE